MLNVPSSGIFRKLFVIIRTINVNNNQENNFGNEVHDGNNNNDPNYELKE